jgi:hypothetical protein
VAILFSDLRLAVLALLLEELDRVEFPAVYEVQFERFRVQEAEPAVVRFVHRDEYALPAEVTKMPPFVFSRFYRSTCLRDDYTLQSTTVFI